MASAAPAEVASAERLADPGGSTGSGSEIQAWVEANFTAKTVGGTTVYDLTSSTGS